MAERSHKKPKSAQGQKAGAQSADPAASKPTATKLEAIKPEALKPEASASHPQAASLPGVERSPFRSMKNPGAKGHGAKGPGVKITSGKSPLFSITSHGTTSDKATAGGSTIAASGPLAALSPSVVNPGCASGPKEQDATADIPEKRVFAERGTVGDAAVALTMCTCVALPIHCGLGGGVMALYYNKYDTSRKEKRYLICTSKLYLL
ncbi:uncharacterized protein [Dermacentor andersoni]|uniref:uncharacterized protein n=1 Tax=Dermacentor andersoni TaxID=34620 RepID=UPI002416F11A|nr:uncharacterized protein LOC129383392 [Dermacentor andersoni]